MRAPKNNNYSLEFKEDAVRRYLAGEDNYAQLARQLASRDAKRLRTWVNKVRQGEPFDERVYHKEHLAEALTTFATTEADVYAMKSSLLAALPCKFAQGNSITMARAMPVQVIEITALYITKP